MATKPRAAKAATPAPVSKRAASSAPKAVVQAARPAVKATSKPVAKVAAKPATKAATKAAAKPPVKAVKPIARTAKSAAPVAVKPAVKSVGKVALPVALKRAVKAVVATAAPAAGNPALVRDSFTMPEAEYAVFASAKQRCLQAGVEIKKSELLRIGMALVGQLDVATLQAVLAGLPQLKTGRPRSEQASL